MFGDFGDILVFRSGGGFMVFVLLLCLSYMDYFISLSVGEF